MKILVTGAGGLVGTRLARELKGGNEILAVGHLELDITDLDSASSLVREYRPDTIFNCAVIGVDECETDQAKAQAVNVEGPANLARSAADCGAAIVHFSTNYVFDGMRAIGSYTVDDEPKPVNRYGRTKWTGEQAVVAECERSFIIRTSWVYGGGKNSFFDNAIAALRAGKPVEAITDNWASTTHVGDLVDRVAEIVASGHYGTYHVVNEGVCSKYDFAVAAARILGRAADLVVPVRSADTSYIAARPGFTPMSCRLSTELGLDPLRNWETALSEFITNE